MSWTKCDNNTYAAFASDIESFKKTTGKGPRCPLCREELKMSFIFKHAVAHGEEPYASFENEHTCGAHIKIFND